MSGEQIPDFSSGKLCVDDLQAAFDAILSRIKTLEDNPPAATVPGAILADGTVPFTGCPELPSGCNAPEHAVRWKELNALLEGRYVGVVVDALTDSGGCIIVQYPKEMTGAITVTATQGDASALSPAAGVGEVQGMKVTTTSTRATVCCYDKNGAVIAGKGVKLHVQAIGGG